MKVENVNRTIEFENGSKVKLIENLSFEIMENKITSIVAPLQSGKTTLLKILAGLEGPEKENKLPGKVIFMPSEPSSFPWLNVEDNIRFTSGIDKNELAKVIDLVGLTGYEKHYPNDKSLGFRFRIALARALTLNPSLVLLDEPFTKMNPNTKTEILQLILDINKKLNTSFLLATSDLTESILLSERIYLMKKAPSKIIYQTEIEHDQTEIRLRLNSSTFTQKYSELTEEMKKIEAAQLISN